MRDAQPAGHKGAFPPEPALSDVSARQDRLDNAEFEKQSLEYSKPTTRRPALIVDAEISTLRRTYSLGSSRLEMLTKVKNIREAVWQESQGEEPLTVVSATDRAKAETFFKEHGTRLADPPRQAPPNPLKPARAAEPAAAKDTSTHTSTPTPAGLDPSLVLLTRIAKASEAQAAQMSALANELKALREQLAQVATAPAASADNPPKCKYHGAMKPSKKPGAWYCPKKLADGSYCDQKVGE